VMSSGSIIAAPEVSPLSPFLRGAGWGEGQPQNAMWIIDLYPLTRIAHPEVARKHAK